VVGPLQSATSPAKLSTFSVNLTSVFEPAHVLFLHPCTHNSVLVESEVITIISMLDYIYNKLYQVTPGNILWFNTMRTLSFIANKLSAFGVQVGTSTFALCHCRCSSFYASLFVLLCHILGQENV
jgi:hypothetical protein